MPLHNRMCCELVAQWHVHLSQVCMGSYVLQVTGS